MANVHKIAVFGGDGIGPEVTDEAMRVLDAVAELDGFRVERTSFPHGSEHFLATGELMRIAVNVTTQIHALQQRQHPRPHPRWCWQCPARRPLPAGP